MRPVFSAMKMRPLDAKRASVGLSRPDRTTESLKPAGVVTALGCDSVAGSGVAAEGCPADRGIWQAAKKARTARLPAMRRDEKRWPGARAVGLDMWAWYLPTCPALTGYFLTNIL